MDAHLLGAIALAVAALALALFAGLLIVRARAVGRSERTLRRALDERALQGVAQAAAAAAAAAGGRGEERADGNAAGKGAGNGSGNGSGNPAARGARPTGVKGFFEHVVNAGARWIDTPFGRQVVAEEDRRLLEQCGFVDVRTRGLFLIARIVCGVTLPLLAGVFASGRVSGSMYVLLVVMAIVLGFMLPKLYLSRRARQRRNGVVDELPLLVDLLRLLQGVGLSLDQSLQVMVNDFRTVLPVLSSELEIAQRQFAAGRSREQSLGRLSASFDNEDLNAVVRLLVQVDRHGGAVQEPLKQFGDRLREARRAMLRERIGRLTVKMTGVMILTLLPALMIVTAGPGVLAVTKSLHSMHR